MNITPKYVSEDNVDLLNFIFSLFSTKEGLALISSVLQLFLGGNEPCSKDACAKDEPDQELDALFEEISGKKISPITEIGEGYALNPICNIADKQIIYSLTLFYGRKNAVC